MPSFGTRLMDMNDAVYHSWFSVIYTMSYQIGMNVVLWYGAIAGFRQGHTWRVAIFIAIALMPWRDNK